MMKRVLLAAALLPLCPVLHGAEQDGVQTIRLRQDDAQVRFDSKVYELKHIAAEDILPFVNTAVRRYSRNSTVRRITAGKDGNAILVSTGRDFMPYVDAVVAALDRPGKLKDGSAISGTGLSRVAYVPKFRAAADFSGIINSTLGSSSGSAYVNEESNTIFWRDQSAAAKRTLSWINVLDRPLPQAKVRLNYYELRDSDLKDWGFDYLAWKNGPGVNLLNVGYNAGRMVFDELLNNVPYAFTTTWGLGGFFTAPQFDMSFIRCLQQSGNANVASSASLVMVSTPVGTENEFQLLKQIQERRPDIAPFIYRISMKPEYQNIAKNVLGRTFLGKSYYEDELGNKYPDPPAMEAKLVNPFICIKDVPGVPESAARKAAAELPRGGILFDYALYFKNVVERGNTGAELSNSSLVTGAATLAFGQEKILAVYEKENDVEQTIGLPILCRIPVIKYLFSTVTSIKERTYIVISAEAELVDLNNNLPHGKDDKSISTGVHRRIENPFRDTPEQ